MQDSQNEFFCRFAGNAAYSIILRPQRLYSAPRSAAKIYENVDTKEGLFYTVSVD